jgi:hypothetical protein
MKIFVCSNVQSEQKCGIPFVIIIDIPWALTTSFQGSGPIMMVESEHSNGKN